MGYTANAKLEEFFDAAPLYRSCERITEKVGERITAGVRRRTPVASPPAGMGLLTFAGSRGRAPGTLKNSWTTGGVEESISPTGTPRFGIDSYTEDPIAEYVEWPTAPHTIRPRPDRAPASVIPTKGDRRQGTEPEARLRFINRSGRVVFAAEVHHPGTQGVHMMRDALMEADSSWESWANEEVQRWAREQTALVR